jgi:hypothetical protein
MAKQLELELITAGGILTTRHNPCPDMTHGTLPPGAIPGLDATLCRCGDCTARAPGGVWWFDAEMRHNVRKRITPYRFTVVAGDGLRDNE